MIPVIKFKVVFKDLAIFFSSTPTSDVQVGIILLDHQSLIAHMIHILLQYLQRPIWITLTQLVSLHLDPIYFAIYFIIRPVHVSYRDMIK